MPVSHTPNVAIVGGGLVGALEACLLAQRGFRVTLFESRHDGRHEPSYYGRSINLAISLRGISALKRLGLDSVVEARGIPMRARMIHNLNGRQTPIPYDPDGKCIYSIERAQLNNFLLDKAESHFKVDIKFNHKLVDMNAERGVLWFRQSDYKLGDEHADGQVKAELLMYEFDLILGCDGSRSSVRSLLSRQAPIEVRQSFIEHGYLELRIDPDERDGSFRMPTNYLHIWPRGQYMMIALPNKDASFTCTLFMPFEMLEKLRDPHAALKFFEQKFPDSIELIGAKRIQDTLSQVTASSLISISCSPYYYKGSVALLGDSAHAMVPFYGQGMNCGFEDCLVLDELLDKYLVGSPANGLNSDQTGPRLNGTMELSNNMNGDAKTHRHNAIARVLEEYSNIRCPNGHAMCELAMYNYIEMRDLVNSWSYLLRKHVDNVLYRLLGSRWIPLYTMVTFSRLPINECVERRRKQDATIDLWLSASVCFGFGWLLHKVLRHHLNLRS